VAFSKDTDELSVCQNQCTAQASLFHFPDDFDRGSVRSDAEKLLFELTEIVFHHRARQAFSTSLRHVQIEERSHALFAAIDAFNIVVTARWTNHRFAPHER